MLQAVVSRALLLKGLKEKERRSIFRTFSRVDFSRNAHPGDSAAKNLRIRLSGFVPGSPESTEICKKCGFGRLKCSFVRSLTTDFGIHCRNGMTLIKNEKNGESCDCRRIDRT